MTHLNPADSDAPTRFAVPEAVLSTELDGEAVILHMDTRRYYQLNETAAVIWGALQRSGERAAALGELLGRFEVDEEEAARELDRVLGDMMERHLIVPEAEGP